MVFCYQNCSDILWERIVLVIEKNFWQFANEGRKLEKKGWIEQFFKQNALLSPHIKYVRTIQIQIGKHLDLETYRKGFDKYIW